MNAATSAETSPTMRIVMVTTYGDSHACARLQTGAIFRGLRDTAGSVQCQTVKPSAARSSIEGADCIGFHYHDVEAMTFLRHNRHLAPAAAIACFGADIYDFGRYTELCDLASFFVMPTSLHRSVLASQMSLPVYTLEEPFDPIAIDAQTDWRFPPKKTRHLGWFGYPESFYKSMLSLMPTIKACLDAGQLDGFKLLTDSSRFPNDLHLDLQAFSTQTFAADVRAFDYVLVSHFPLDLHVNSLIKSPNKAVTALVAGAIPIASATPSYEALFCNLGLQKFLFDSPRSLSRLLRTRDPVADSRFIQDMGALEKIRTTMSDSETASAFLGLLQMYLTDPANTADAIAVAVPITYEAFARDRVKLISRLKRAMQRR